MATLSQIARSAGVSIPTVSRVLNGKGRDARISEQRAAEIISIAEQMGYRPNAAARSTRSGRFNTVSLLLGTNYRHSILPSGLLGGIHDGLAAHDQHLLLARLPDADLANHEKMPRLLREWNCDGLLINYTENIPPATLDLIARYRLPAVWLNTNLPHDCVHPDDEAGAHAATRHLIALGHRRIAYSGRPIEAGRSEGDIHYSVLDRQSGYERAMVEAGLEPVIWHYEKSEQPSDHLHLDHARRHLSAADPRPTALLTYSFAPSFIVAAMQLGLSVPGDLSLITFDSRPVQFPGLPVSTTVIDFHAVGQAAAEMILKKIAAPAASLSCRKTPVTLSEGATLAKAPRA